MTSRHKSPLTEAQLALYTGILKEELITATGCTEPIAIAYCGAIAARVLGKTPEQVQIWCSGNVIKNTKTVTVPNTGGLKGIKAAVLAGVFYGDADKGLDTLAALTPEQAADVARLADEMDVQIRLLKSGHPLHIKVNCQAGEDQAEAEIMDTHTHVAAIRRNGETLHTGDNPAETGEGSPLSGLNLAQILAYARQVPLADLKEVLSGQITHNPALSRAGLEGDWGARVGQTILETRGKDPRAQLVASAAAGSDARMNGCPMPAVINSGSGNQGLTASVPVITRARQMGASEEALMRALAVSNLLAIHQKAGIGRMSAYCGAVSAAVGCAAGIAFLEGMPEEIIERTVTNALMISSGMLCDGAKSSCAAKIAAALDSAFLAYDMARADRAFQPGEGLVKQDTEQTIAAVSRVAREGMKETDVEVLKVMLDE